jgi:restriction system protein
MGPNTNTQANPAAATAPQRPRPGGGYTERPPAPRPAEQPRHDQSDPSDPTDRSDQTNRTAAAPVCPACGTAMMLRTARKGPRAGSQFWGCTGFPECRKTVAV